MHSASSSIKPRSFDWDNVIKRVTFGVIMSVILLTVILMGPVVLVGAVFAIQVFCFREILRIGYDRNRIPSLPHFRALCWYFLMAANYFFSLETIGPHFDIYNKLQDFYYLSLVVKYHRFISFCIYFIGIVLFVLNLVRKYDLKQFKILAWTHTLLILIVLQSYLAIQNLFFGIIWLILPIVLVTLNDIFAYLFGRIWGKTPLIELSPKKTWEGFLGGIIGTLVSGFFLSNLMCSYSYFICPIEYDDVGYKLTTQCDPGYLFTPLKYPITVYPFTNHFLSLALFASIIAPFGGFCASGFKRAFKLKDFGDVIPGHGGIMDRCDCQFLMATFVNVYIFTFVKIPNVELLFERVLYMDVDSQVQFYHMLRDALQAST